MGGRIAEVLQGFVDRKALVGSVTAVADKDRVISLDAVGFADVATGQADARGCGLLDRLSVQAHHGHRVHDAGGRRQGRVEDPVEKYLPEFKEMWVVAEQEEEHRLLRRPSGADHRAADSEPHQRPAVRVADGGADAGSASAHWRRRPQLRQDSPGDRTGDAV